MRIYYSLVVLQWGTQRVKKLTEVAEWVTTLSIDGDIRSRSQKIQAFETNSGNEKFADLIPGSGELPIFFFQTR